MKQVTSENYATEAARFESPMPSSGLQIDLTEGSFLVDASNQLVEMEKVLSSLKKAIFYRKPLSNDDVRMIDSTLEISGVEFMGARITQKQARLLHGSLGLVTEALELYKTVFEHVINGKELDAVNIGEESGDALWFLALILNVTGSSFEKEMERNIAKLTARYGEKFSQKSALNRNLPGERKVLEK